MMANFLQKSSQRLIYLVLWCCLSMDRMEHHELVQGGTTWFARCGGR